MHHQGGTASSVADPDPRILQDPNSFFRFGARFLPDRNLQADRNRTDILRMKYNKKMGENLGTGVSLNLLSNQPKT